MVAARENWFEDEDLDDYPAAFTRDLLKALLRSRPAANNSGLGVMEKDLCVEEASEDLQDNKTQAGMDGEDSSSSSDDEEA
jgi:hypothetical protein